MQALILRISAGLVLMLGCFSMPSQATPSTCQILSEAQNLPVSNCNRAFSVHVLQQQRTDEFAGRTAPAEQQWLVLTMRFENWLAADVIFKLQQPEALLVGSLRRELYLLINGAEVARPHHATEDSFVLGQIGSSREVEVGFLIPQQNCDNLLLGYHHESYGDILIPLKGGELPPVPTPLQSGENDLMNLALLEAQLLPEYNGHTAGIEQQWLVVDLRGQSNWRIDVPALALQATAKPADKRQLVRVMEYVGADKMLQAVVDNRYGYLPSQEHSSLLKTPAWLPHRSAGGKLAYLIPKTVTSLELTAYFGAFLAPGIDSRYRQPIRFSLTSLLQQQAPKKTYTPLKTLQDGPLQLQLRQLTRQARDNGEDVVSMLWSMQNTTSDNGTLNLEERFRLTVSAAKTITPARVLLSSEVDLSSPLLLPAREARWFTTEFHLPRAVQAVTMDYQGVGGQQQWQLELPN